MTDYETDLKTVNKLDPRLKCMKYANNKNNLEWSIYKGVSNSAYEQENANTYSTTNVQYKFNTRSSTSLIDRRIYQKINFNIVITGTAPVGSRLIADGYGALRAFPITSATQNVSLNMGSNEISCNDYSKAIKALLRYNTNFDLMNYDLSMCPSFLDVNQEYFEGINTSNNPLACFKDSSPFKMGRGGMYYTSFVNPISTDAAVPFTATVGVTVVEPIFLSPFVYSSAQEPALTGIKNIALTFTFKSEGLNNIWSHSTGASVISDVTTSIVNAPQLLINYMDAPPSDFYQMPEKIYYEYYKTEVLSQDIPPTLNSLASRTIIADSINLGTIPKAIYIYAQRKSTEQSYATTDTFAIMSNLQINYFTSSQFGTATDEQIYQICNKNGLDMSYTQFGGRTQTFDTSRVSLSSAPICITTADLNLPEHVSSGMISTNQFRITATITNPSVSNNINYELVTIFVYEGLAIVDTRKGFLSVHDSIVTSDMVMNARKSGEITFAEPENNIYGGNIWDKFKDFKNSSCDIVRKSMPYVRRVCGDGLEYRGGAMADGMRGGKGSKIGAYKGLLGKLAKKKDLTSAEKERKLKYETYIKEQGKDLNIISIKKAPPKKKSSRKKIPQYRCPTGTKKICKANKSKGGEMLDRAHLLRNMEYESE